MLRTFFRQFTEQNIIQHNIRVPIFALDPEKITVISEPDKFYSKLKELASQSRYRISISSLYLGTTDLEKNLLKSIVSNRNNSSVLKIRFLLDYNRANRETLSLENGKKLGKSSKFLLLQLVKDYGVEVSFFLTHRLSGWKRFIQHKQEWNELCALHHMKLYIFDNDLIISGANLSDLYFKNRQDRYFHIKDAPELCDYFDQVIKTISNFSMKLNPDGQFSLHKNWKYDPRLRSHRSNYVKAAREAIQNMNEQFLKNQDKFQISSNDTFAIPLLNIASIGHCDEENFTIDFLKNVPENSNLHIASGYFNLTKNYQNIMLKQKNIDSILMASEEANGFFNGRGLLKFVPFVYTDYLRKFLERLTRDEFKTRIWYYKRPNWSFHAKGIWLFNPNFFLTFIGSSNFGYRSTERDNEAQLVIVSKNDRLRRMLYEEHQNMVNHSREIVYPDSDLPNVPFWVRCYARLFRSYF